MPEGSVGKNVVELIEEGKIDMVLNTAELARIAVGWLFDPRRGDCRRPAAVHHHDRVLGRADGD